MAHYNFCRLIRFNKENVEWLTSIFLGNHVETRGAALSCVEKMEIFLRSLGDPGFQVGVAADIGVHQTTVSKIVAEVATKIVEKKNVWISFPRTPHEVEQAKEGWHIQGAIGALDCTHIRITKPQFHGEEYLNRKNFYSINVQATCNHKEIFTSVDASWPGSVHDNRVWRNSDTCRNFSGNNNEACLLGDQGYGITPWLLVSYRNPNNEIERFYNRVHNVDRVKIERCFGQLKRRFPMLHYTLRLKTDRICTYITAGFILHNVAKYLKDPDDFDPIDEDEEAYHINIPVGDALHVRQLGQQRRNVIAEELFQRDRCVFEKRFINNL